MPSRLRSLIITPMATYPSQPTTDAEAAAYARHLTDLHGATYGAYRSAAGPSGHHYCALQPHEAADLLETGWSLIPDEN